MLFYVIAMAGGVIVDIFDDGIFESFSYEFLIKSLNRIFLMYSQWNTLCKCKIYIREQ